MTAAPDDVASYCSVCRGVLPFRKTGSRMAGLSCTRCGTTFRQADPGGPERRRAGRYLLYGGAAGLSGSLMAAGAALLGPGHSLARAPGQLAALFLLCVLAAGCLARSAVLRLRASRYERLAPHEWAEASRRLYIGMIRSDVEEELFRRGWRPGKVRSVLESLRPVPATPGAAAPREAPRRAG